MSKELEALGQFRMMIGALSLESIEIIEQALTPPTAEQVCEVLNKHYNFVLDFKSCYYNTIHREFGIKTDKNKYVIVHMNEYGEIYWNGDYALPPHIIELIGRFYKGVKE